jgi:hypothetical protein
MLRRRQKKNTLKIRTACGGKIEQLEKRMLLTTIVDSGNGFTASSIEYKDASDALVRVTYSGVTAELVFGNVSKTAPQRASTADLVSPGDTVTPGRDLFHIYVQKATVDSYISIARVPGLTANPRPMQPFGGGVSFNTNNLRTGDLVAVTSGPGDVLLGARTKQLGTVVGSENRAIIQMGFNGLGIMPATKNGKLMAGLSVAPKQDLGKFLLGGTIIGSVYVPSGSIKTFYCGALLTGDARGQRSVQNGAVFEPPGVPQIPNNFYIGGDLRDLIVMGSIGTNAPQPNPDEPIYVVGTDVEIHGRSNQIRSFNMILAKTWVHNDPKAPKLGSAMEELERRATYLPSEFFAIPGGDVTDFENGVLGDRQPNFNNDTFDTPQFLGVFNSKKLGANAIQVDGIVNEIPDAPDKDIVDYYALPLMAGQTITVRLINGGDVGVYDPDQRLVASSYLNNFIEGSGNGSGSNLTTATLFNSEKPFQVTAQKPGIYRFAIGEFGGANDGFGGLLGGTFYQLRITGAGNLGLGALAATSAISNRTNTGTGPLVPPPEPSAMVVNGDFGAVWVQTGRIIYTGVAEKPDIEAHGGNLRAVDALQIGRTTAGTATEAPTFFIDQSFLANHGNIGMVRARTGDLVLETVRATQKNGKGPGGSIQLLSVESGFFYGQVFADKALGTIIANDMNTLAPSGITVNADKLGRDGIIDLIDVKNQMGVLGAGGPAITTNQGGNVRYMRAGGAVFRDRFFGGGSPEQTTFVQGQEAVVNDDSGTQIRIQPAPNTLDDLTGGTTDAGTLTLITYPIRSGGVVVMNVQSSRGVTVTSSGIRGGAAEIGRIESFATGAPLINDPGPDFIIGSADDPKGPDNIANSGDEPLILDPSSTLPENNILISGNARTDVLELKGNTFNSIRNRTGGEIVSTNITGTVGLLESATLGLPRNSTGMPPRFARISDVSNTPLAITAGVVNTFPFRDQRNGIVVVGNVAQIRSTLGMGNLMINGRVGSIVANSDGKGVSGVVEGINAPIFVTGNITSVNIGEGVLPSGSGGMSQAGIYSMGRIGTVANQGLGSDIRGNIIAADNIDQISLRDGAIIGATIGTIEATGVQGVAVITNTGADLEASRRFGQAFVTTSGANINGQPTGEITRMGLRGKGGIMGSTFLISNMGPIDIKGGFGIFNSYFSLTGAGRVLPIITDGYGIRNTVFQGGAFGVAFNARATGKQLPVTAFSPSVRLSEKYKFDPYTGASMDFFTDLHAALGTSSRKPIRTASTYGGAIQNSSFVSSRDLGTMTADRISDVTVSYGNQVGTIAARKTISKLRVTSGGIANLTTGGSMDRSNFTIAGPLSNVHIGGSYLGSNRILTQGPNGSIGTMVVDGSLYGTIEAAIAINTLRVGQHVGSSLVLTGGNIKQLIIGGSVLTGSSISVQKTLAQLVINGDVQEGASITAREITKKKIGGKALGTVVG